MRCLVAREAAVLPCLDLLCCSFKNTAICKWQMILIHSGGSISASFVFFAWILAVFGVLAFRALRQDSACGAKKPGSAENDDPEPPTIY
ncbi:hypothetical protein TcWFU_007936 [Taenia crassiceps]|uniref:Uncharacterized protein n=1 Tax=Taenia crassiceps TaxID=6207 RepID=A0ABR4QMD6_9CEST